MRIYLLISRYDFSHNMLYCFLILLFLVVGFGSDMLLYFFPFIFS